MTTLKALKERERESRRQLIISAAQKLFAKNDFRRVTVREIARETGVSAGTIYRYYANLDELFLEILLINISNISQLITEEFHEKQSCSLKRYCEIHVTYLNDHMSFFKMMSYFMLGDPLPSETASKMDPVMRELMDHIEYILREEGMFVKARMTAHSLFSALNGTMISYAHYPGRSLEEIREHTLSLAEIIAERFSCC